MPTYEYICRACGHEFEEFHSIKADPIAICPKCRKKKVERKIGIGGAVIFKGGGFYETDYRSESYRSGEDAEKKSRDAKPEGKPDAPKSEAPKSDASKSDASKSDASRSADAKPGAGKPESKGEASKSEAPKADASKSESKPGSTPTASSSASAENKRIEDRATHRSRIGRGVGNIVKKPAAAAKTKPARKPK